MPEANDFDQLIAVVHSINDPVGSNDDLAEGFVRKFGYYSPSLGKQAQAHGLVDQEHAEAKRLRAIASRDVPDDFVYVRSGGM